MTSGSNLGSLFAGLLLRPNRYLLRWTSRVDTCTCMDRRVSMTTFIVSLRDVGHALSIVMFCSSLVKFV